MCSQLALCFLQRHCAPSDLHSFPTRRSSDLTGAVFQMFNHGTITAMLFLIVGVIYDRAHTRGLNDFGGLMNQMPKYSGVMVIAFFAALGLPGLSGFISEAFSLLGAFQAFKWIT